MKCQKHWTVSLSVEAFTTLCLRPIMGTLFSSPRLSLAK